MKKLFLLILSSMLLFSCGLESDATNDNAINSLSGSYTKMMIVGDYIYAIHDEELTTLDITDPEHPTIINVQQIGFKIENIFHHEGVLFIGAEQGLTIYTIGENGIPQKESQTNYFRSNGITSCDPVIVSGDYAYITLSTISAENSPCFRQIQVNELRIYNIEDLSKPELLSVTEIQQPKGLSIDDNFLFVCEAALGLSVLDISNPFEPKIINQLRGFKSRDVIAKDGLLMIVSPSAILQYNYNNIEDIQYLSTIDL